MNQNVDLQKNEGLKGNRGIKLVMLYLTKQFTKFDPNRPIKTTNY